MPHTQTEDEIELDVLIDLVPVSMSSSPIPAASPEDDDCRASIIGLEADGGNVISSSSVPAEIGSAVAIDADAASWVAASMCLCRS